MKRVLSLFLAIIMVSGVLTSVPLTASAVGDEDLTFEINEDGTMYQVKKCNSDVSGDVVIPSIYKGLPVTKIASNAFYYCDSLRSITIPASIKVIGEGAFYGCYNLDAVYITDVAAWCELDFKHNSCNPLYYAQNLYVNNTLVKDLVVPDCVTQISDFAFIGCTNIVSVTLPDTVMSIGERSFENCCLLETVEFSNSVTKISRAAFQGCSSLKSVTIPDSVISVETFAFYNCTSLASVNISENIKEISQWSFGNCTNLKSVVIPDGMLCINMYAFYNCSSLNSLMLGNNIKSIMRGSFYNCSNLKSITIPKTVDSINSDYSVGTCPSDVNITWEEHAFGYQYSSWEETSVKIEDFTIYGYKGSAAEVYANENGFTFIEICEHNTTKWVTDVKATADKVGSKHKECTKCGKILETSKIAQLKCEKPSFKKIENTADGVKLTWDKVEGADKYEIYCRKGSKGKYTKLGTTSKNYVTHKKAKSGNKYYYYVVAVNEVGSSEASKAKSIYYLADPTLKTPKSTKSGIVLKWNKIAGADGYMVYRKTGSGSYSKIATVKGNSKVTYTDKKAQKGKTYTYKIKAYKGNTTSAYSNTKKIKDKY